jgi:hypothetical protein
MFHIYITSVLFGVAYVCNSFQLFLQNVSDACFECFIYLFLYVVSVASECFKSRSDVAHRMRIGSGRGASGPFTGNIRAAQAPARVRVMQARSSDVRAAQAHAWMHETERKPTAATCIRMWVSVRTSGH